ncbi:hypothetical protein [Bacillus sp. S/N-304-OC-R1]|uniref:hypothetical protein n=1 Tax=Bacillus sp. S/N-304-OC-R1 TaxID=2758034 RepID=UPI001C8E502D|nr:hypothetical protein [Bacillus sp. S/N-304-OC-R1]MBY0123325.1 hypothetical protein [Bacillus sp. S/N-304-OC-R1]
MKRVGYIARSERKRQLVVKESEFHCPLREKKTVGGKRELATLPAQREKGSWW